MTDRMEKIGMHNSSEDGRNARDALHVHTTQPNLLYCYIYEVFLRYATILNDGLA
jgi:hypothetical protein